jgi:small subunit ribosomal protein S16
MGRRHCPLFRIVAAHSSARRDGRYIEGLGVYNPSPKGEEVKLTLDEERVKYWLGVGAQPTDTVRALIRQACASIA